MKFSFVCLLTAAMLSGAWCSGVGCAMSHAQSDGADDAPPIELGKVHWERDLEKSLQQSATESKPVLLLFQEVPG